MAHPFSSMLEAERARYEARNGGPGWHDSHGLFPPAMGRIALAATATRDADRRGASSTASSSESWRRTGRKSAAMMVFAMLSGAITLVLKVTGKLESNIDRAGERLHPESSPQRGPG